MIMILLGQSGNSFTNKMYLNGNALKNIYSALLIFCSQARGLDSGKFHCMLDSMQSYVNLHAFMHNLDIQKKKY